MDINAILNSNDEVYGTAESPVRDLHQRVYNEYCLCDIAHWIHVLEEAGVAPADDTRRMFDEYRQANSHIVNEN